MTAIVNNEAEASVLGAVLMDGTLFKELMVQEAHFYHAHHRQIFLAMKEVSDQNDFIDMVTVTTKLGDAITQIGGTIYLLEMADSVASTAAMKHHERLIFDAYRARISKACALQFAEDPTDQALDTLITRLQAFREVGVDKQDKTTYDYLLEISEEMCFPTGEQSGFCTSFGDLDDMTGGLQRGELIIVAARPSVGKTAFALNLAAGHATNGGISLPTTLSPLRYPGGKTQLYKFIRNVIEQNDIRLPIYVEPFAGGAGLAIELLLKGDVDSIIINDFDKAIYSFWSCVLHDTNNLIYLIENTAISITEWEKQKRIYNNQLNHTILEVGFATFFLNRTNRSGIIKGGPISRDSGGKYPLHCRFNKVDLINKIRRISSVKDKISLFNYDAVYFIKQVLPIFATDQLFIFFDPPYYKQGKNLYTNFYSHDDHQELCEAIKGIFIRNWITTYDFNENIAKLYEDLPTKVYQLQYSANRKRKEKEFLFHNLNTRVNSFDKVQFIEIE